MLIENADKHASSVKACVISADMQSIVSIRQGFQ